jgi:hypothetical protein
MHGNEDRGHEYHAADPEGGGSYMQEIDYCRGPHFETSCIIEIKEKIDEPNYRRGLVDRP